MSFATLELYSSVKELEDLADRICDHILQCPKLLELLVRTSSKLIERERRYCGSKAFQRRLLDNVQLVTEASFLHEKRREHSKEKKLCLARLNAELYCQNMVPESVAQSVVQMMFEVG
ncbi:hypothetical protein QR680_005010 [Steinernema hermaphroditum]|uniref:Uncharacterized protein n=1 Tax=Steinernema hermaphroditum TaxID=289476 RepID=A0AA39HSQ9_9BILA|nr:hypothetical protein QR680_005010 [Steinernema hermaphroditum]